MTVGFVCDAYFKHALIFQISPFMFVASQHFSILIISS
jgi:hypothetical protein